MVAILIGCIGYLLHENDRLTEARHTQDREIKLLEKRAELNGQLLDLIKVEYEKCSKALEDVKTSATKDKLKLTSLIPQIKEDQLKVDGLKDQVVEQKDKITDLQEHLNSNIVKLMRLRDMNQACENRLVTLEERLASSWFASLWRILGLL